MASSFTHLRTSGFYSTSRHQHTLSSVAPEARLALWLATLVGLALSGCGGDEAACGHTTAEVQAHIFAPRCGTSGCHEGQRASVGLDLVAPDVVARLLRATSEDCNGRRMLVPGDPDGSYLFQKLTGAAPVCGSRMPLGGAPLTSTEVACVRAWITSLAGADAGAIDAAVRPMSDASTDATTPDAPMDAGVSCPAGQLACGAACVNPMTDGMHCGGCGRACPAGLSCAVGACACPMGQSSCGGRCVDTATDGMHCGACGRACPVGQGCSAGACVCPTGQGACAGVCVATATSALHCGACG
ncbi:MAG: hypothetical protein Q8S73_30765, partial [Deltaproteobacteria bacterium]|nr:hypothetical protein [Deltaproteobacteria bacterium]